MLNSPIRRSHRPLSRQLHLEHLEQRVLLHGDTHDHLSANIDATVFDALVETPDDANGNVDHPDDPVKDAEHQALLDLLKSEDATHLAAVSGSWSDPISWAGGSLPSDGARVHIMHDVVLTFDQQESPRLDWILVDGELRFDPNTNTELKVDTLVVAPSGRLEIGTPTVPIANGVQAKILFTDSGPIDTDWDPTHLSRGLISHGSATIHGQAKTTHAALAQAPRAGQPYLVFEEAPDMWEVGDRILIPGVHRPLEDYLNQTLVDEDEIVTIVWLSPDGRIIAVDRDLSYDHLPPQSILKIRVANLDRNVIFESENKTDPRRAGHVMFMHNSDVSVEYATFRHIGRNDKSIPSTNPQIDSAF